MKISPLTPTITEIKRECSKRDLLIAVSVMVVALGFFSWQILSMPQSEVGQFDKYPNAAIQYLNRTIAPERLLDYSPLYLLLNIFAFRFLSSPIQSLLLLHIVCLSAAAFLLYLVLRRQFSPGLSLAGTAIFLFGKSLIIYGYILEPEPLMILFLVALLFFSRIDNTAGNLMTGVSLTLSLLTRPSFVPLILIVPVYYWLVSNRELKKVLVRSGIFLIPVFIGILAVSARNYAVEGFISPMVMSPGTVFYDGNNPRSLGTGAIYPPLVYAVAEQTSGESDYQHAVYREVARRSAGRNLDIRAANKYWASKALNFIVDHPAHFASLTAHRVYYLFHGYRWHDLETAWNAEQFLNASAVPYIPFSVLSAFAIVGLFTAARRWREYFLLFAMFLNQLALMSLTYATDRQRVSLYPLFVLFAVQAVDSMKRKRTAITALPVLLVLTAVFCVKTDIMKDDYYVWRGHAQIGPITEEVIRDRDQRNYEDAKEKAARAEAWAAWIVDIGKPSGMPVSARMLAELASRDLPRIRPESPSRDLDRAVLLIEAGNIDQAELLLTKLSSGDHRFVYMEGRFPEPLYYLARIALLRGDDRKAGDILLRALARSPGEPELLAQLACITGDENYVEQLLRYYDSIDARWFLGRACLDVGRYADAAAQLTQLNSLLPEYAKGRIYLAAVLGKTGNDGDAARLYVNTVGENPGTVLLEDLIPPVFQGWARSGRPEAVYWYGVVLRQYGRFSEAVPYLKRAAAAGYPNAAEELHTVEKAMGENF